MWRLVCAKDCDLLENGFASMVCVPWAPKRSCDCRAMPRLLVTVARGLVAEKVRCRGSLTSRTGCSAKWLQNIDPWLGMLGSVGVIWNLPWSVTCRPVLAVLGACSWGTRCWWHASILENHCISGGLPAQAGTLPLRFLSFLMMPSCRNVKLS